MNSLIFKNPYEFFYFSFYVFQIFWNIEKFAPARIKFILTP